MSEPRRKLIVGFEDTPQGRDALALGARLARRLDGEIVVATVVRYPRGMIGPADLEAALARDTEVPFAYVADELSDLAPRTIAVADSSPAAALQRIADAEGAELLVVGSASHAGHSLVGPGKVGTALLHGAPCAVAVAPSGFAGSSNPLRRLGVAFDGSPEAWSALETGIALASARQAHLTILTAAELPASGFAETLNVITAEELFEARRGEMRRVLELGAARVPDRVETTLRLLDGPAGARITEACEELDMLLLGSRGYGPLRRTLLGSVSRAVLTSAPCPVLVLPRAAGRDPLRLLRDTGVRVAA